MSRLRSALRGLFSEQWLLAAVTLLAGFFRFFRLDQLPPGFEFDQAFNAFDIVRLLDGQLAIFFPANTGREPLFIYLQVVGVALFGPTSFALRFISAIIGLITIPLVYLCARAVFRSSQVGILAALFTAISFWHIFFSRDGLRVILEVPLTLLMFYYLWRALITPRRRDFIRVGLFLALGLYTYPSARVLPLALVLLIAYAAWNDRAHARVYLEGFGLALSAAALLLLSASGV